MMTSQEIQAMHNQIYAKTLVKYLQSQGIDFAVISPGSRNTPLSLALVEAMPYFVAIDERSAGFIALGYAREKQKHVILCCTSGSALTHYLPALTESYYATAPLMILSADRPDRLQGKGAAQTIDQREIFGKYVDTFIQMPTYQGEGLVQAILKIDLALMKQKGKYPQSIHINLPFEEPLWLPSMEQAPFQDQINEAIDLLMESLATHQQAIHQQSFVDLPAEITKQSRMYQIKEGLLPRQIKDRLKSGQTFSICIGAILGKTAQALLPLLLELSQKVRLIIFCEASSQLRGKFSIAENLSVSENLNIIEVRCLEAICKANALNIDADLWIHVGTNTHARAIAASLEQLKASTHLMMADRLEVPNAYPFDLFVYHGQVIEFFEDFLKMRQESIVPKMTLNLAILKKLEDLCRQTQEGLIAQGWWTGQIAHAINTLDQSIREELSIFIANSMPYRDLDFGLMQSVKRIWSARGTNGIDGNLSSVIGGALASQQPVLAWLGDVAFLHDCGALISLSKVKTPLLTIISQNGGGAIFQQLNVVQSQYFETCFFTPYQADLGKLCEAFNIQHQKVCDALALKNLVHQYFLNALSQRVEGSKPLVIEACFDAKLDDQAHQNAWMILKSQIEISLSNRLESI